MWCWHLGLLNIKFLSHDKKFQNGGLLNHHFDIFKFSFFPHCKSDFHEISPNLIKSISSISGQFIICECFPLIRGGKILLSDKCDFLLYELPPLRREIRLISLVCRCIWWAISKWNLQLGYFIRYKQLPSHPIKLFITKPIPPNIYSHWQKIIVFTISNYKKGVEG